MDKEEVQTFDATYDTLVQIQTKQSQITSLIVEFDHEHHNEADPAKLNSIKVRMATLSKEIGEHINSL
ncbi:hypothetical protein Erwinia_phage_Aioli_00002 [Erwinia phage Aioli]|nr:hypothetical protein Erwinia_phage_Aioli_00002 [Erwinia phage Aioli]